MNIDIQVQTRDIPEQTDPDAYRYVFAYTITIANNGKEPVQLFNRYWLITDANGKKVEVQGSGVVGEQPVIEPGESYTYTSGCVLETAVGAMEGYYQMARPGQELENVAIPIFWLAVPNMVH